MPVKEKVWDREEHTGAKHEILRRYLGAWFPILAQTQDRIVYIDGFAGPGVYAGGEDGSPVVALRAALDHPLAHKFREIVFWFIERDRKRHARLDEVLRAKFPSIKNKEGDRISYETVHGKFAETIEEALDVIESRGQNLAPTFAFIDPFGFSTIPMHTVKRILGYPKCEVMVTFMDGYIKRFHGKEHESALDRIYGTHEWREISKSGGDDTYVDLYRRELEKAGAKYVRTFQIMDSSNRGMYNLVYTTKSVKGMEVMKDAMLKVSQTGEYKYSGAMDPRQSVVVDYRDADVWRPLAAKSVFERFRGQKDVAPYWTREHVVGHTPYPFNKSILKELEEDGRIEGVTNRARTGTYPDRCRMTFSS